MLNFLPLSALVLVAHAQLLQKNWNSLLVCLRKHSFMQIRIIPVFDELEDGEEGVEGAMEEHVEFLGFGL
jgi:hypothetical protein